MDASLELLDHVILFSESYSHLCEIFYILFNSVGWSPTVGLFVSPHVKLATCYELDSRTVQCNSAKMRVRVCVRAVTRLLRLLQKRSNRTLHNEQFVRVTAHQAKGLQPVACMRGTKNVYVRNWTLEKQCVGLRLVAGCCEHGDGP